jgi:hypothetical protein
MDNPSVHRLLHSGISVYQTLEHGKGALDQSGSLISLFFIVKNVTKPCS